MWFEIQLENLYFELMFVWSCSVSPKLAAFEKVPFQWILRRWKKFLRWERKAKFPITYTLAMEMN